jgi:hypothetical protein
MVEIISGGQASGTVEFQTMTKNDSSNPSDPNAWHWTGLGDQ